jgi:glutamate-ammonia-ligase adenylyltransferase
MDGDIAQRVCEALRAKQGIAGLLGHAGFAEPQRLALDLEPLGLLPDVAALGPEFWRRVLASPDPAGVALHLRRFVEAGGRLDEATLEVVVPLFAQSEEVARTLVCEPQWAEEISRSPFLRRARPLASMREALGDLGEDPRAVMARLRRFRRCEHARIAWRDVTGVAPLPELLGELSDLAEAVVDAATAWALAATAVSWGTPVGNDGRPCRFCVLGLGKLGGRELNFSSDIDLIYVYETDEGTVRGGTVSLHEFFTRVARTLTRILGEATEDGFAFRVDLDLRPEGKRGPLVNSLGALESYYESWGQTWERVAMQKARPVAGDRALGEQLLRGLFPFVYRRNLDPTAIEEIRVLKARIDAEEAERGAPWNVKLGRGGIREIEFFAGAHQLLFGGRRERLRSRSTLETLATLPAEGLADPEEADALCKAYLFLRRLEHRLQIALGRQIHRLPEPLSERARLARRLGLADISHRWDDARVAAVLDREILRHRRVVMAAFDELFRGEGAEEDLPPPLAHLEEARPGLPPGPEAREALCRLGLRDPEAAFGHLARLARTAGTPFHPGAPARTRALGPRLLHALGASPDPDLALRHSCEFLLRLRGRLGSYALLRENPATLRTLLQLFGTSDYLAKLVVHRPELLDPLVIGVVTPRRRREDLRAEVRGAAAKDDEARLDAWRRVKAEEILRIGLSDVAGTLELQEVQGELTVLAEVILEEVLSWALAAVEGRFGPPVGSKGPVALCIVGMGKLGGGELNYNSDLDLLFLYGEEAPCAGDPRRGSQEFFSRVAQKVLFGLSCVTSEGFLYHLDTRLRPSGRQGSLVSSLPAFAHYHEVSAQSWERLALVRARPVAGPDAFREEVRRILNLAAYERPWPAEGTRKVDRIRQRMEAELAREGPAQYNVKLGRGGLVDVEFATQLLQLHVGREHSEARCTSTLGALSALQDLQAWDSGELETLGHSYLFLRRLENRLRIFHDNAQSLLPRDPQALELLARRMGYRDGGAALLRAYEETTSRVREIYLHVVEALC